MKNTVFDLKCEKIRGEMNKHTVFFFLLGNLTLKKTNLFVFFLTLINSESTIETKITILGEVVYLLTFIFETLSCSVFRYEISLLAKILSLLHV